MGSCDVDEVVVGVGVVEIEDDGEISAERRTLYTSRT